MNPFFFIAIGLIVLLLGVFVVSFVLYRRTPVPKGCEDLVADKAKCDACPETNCPFAEALGKKEGK